MSAMGEPSTQQPVPRWTDFGDAVRSEGRSALRPLLVDVLDGLWSVLVVVAATGISFALVPEASIDGVLPVVLIVIGVLVGDSLGNPLLRRLASFGSLVLAMALGLGGQLAVVLLVIWLAPGVTVAGWEAALLVVVIASAIMVAGRWLMGATDSGYVVGRALGRRRVRASRRRAASNGDALEGGARRAWPAPRGLLVVMLDGVSPTVLQRAIVSGQAPHLSTWIRGGSHTMRSWWATIPSTTPASMAGFLHGDDTNIPAFRWWDRDEQRLMASSSPADSAQVEARFEAGRGLLRGGGAAVSTTYSGEAETSLLVISQAIKARGLGSGRFYVSFFSYPLMLIGTVLLTLGEMVKELYQGHRQRVRGVRPRVSRRGAYVLLRGITNVLLRKLNLVLVATLMNEGRPIIFVDHVDYDEVAHLAGPERPEALRSLEGLDAVLGHLAHAARVVSTEYQLVVLSDHGQSLGETFEQVSGRTLTDHVRALMRDADVRAVQQDRGEEWGPVNALVTSVVGRVTSRPERLVLGPDRRLDRSRPDSDELPDVAVIGSGNLAMVWFPRLQQRATLDVVDAHWPGLVTGLVLTDAIGVVMAHSADGGPVVIGRTGVHYLSTSVVEGQDPLREYGSRAAADLRRLASVRNCGDLVLLSTVDDMGLVHAFEEQAGSHGGIGGLQNEALLVHPADWPVDADLLEHVDGQLRLVGPVSVHRQLLRWRQRHGAGPHYEQTVAVAR